METVNGRLLLVLTIKEGIDRRLNLLLRHLADDDMSLEFQIEEVWQRFEYEGARKLLKQKDRKVLYALEKEFEDLVQSYNNFHFERGRVLYLDYIDFLKILSSFI